ncbi:MAG: capsular polysaccharide biosynthesis protein, partial [Aquificaceae bacterium]
YLEKDDRVYWITQDVNSLSLLGFFDKVYTVSSQMGFEALLLGKKVVCFGMPFYAGWGLTEDRVDCSRREKGLSLLELFCGAYIKYCRYLDPKTGKRGTIFDVIEFILRQREWAEKVGRFNYYCVDFHIARKSYVKPFLNTKNNEVYFIKSKDIPNLSFSERDVLVVWGSKSRRRIEDVIKGALKILTVEDGFIRSYGLGADFVPPMSLVFDSRGIYYDPSCESDLEYLLNNHHFSEEELEEAERIRKLIVNHDITKYNLRSEKELKVSTDKRVLLVIGQVEDDEAVLLSGGDIKTNLQLLKRVRGENPDSYILFKPHPDTLSKNRRGYRLDTFQEWADRIELEADIIDSIKVADEVHVLTSLSGFEALIRNKKVFTYGAPFYAGWGLTQDYVVPPRRRRRLTLQELIAGALILYPVYYDWMLKGFVDCKTVINRIVYQRLKNKLQLRANLPRPLKKLVNYTNFILWRLSLK